MGTKSKKSQKSNEITSQTQNLSQLQQPDEIKDEVKPSENLPKVLVDKVDAVVDDKKSHRKRKKHYYNLIRAQMEFYFGDANLSKDRFLKQMIDKDPYIPLDTFLTFNKMKSLTERVEDIAKSLSKSDLLELDETQLKVKRRTALPESRNVDEKTLYVEALPQSADHEWVRQIFERFGKVAYISLPKYAKSRKIKEFGFVEFEKEESVNKAIKVFKEFNGVLSMQEKDPSELISVKSYIKEKAGEEFETPQSTGENRKRGKQESGDDTEPIAKKVKTDDVAENKTANSEGAKSQSESEVNTGDENKAENMDEDANKKKRKRKKKSKSDEKLKRKAELNTDVSYYELKVLPKKDWKRLRNRYLNLQREKVAELKRKAWRERQETKQQSKDIAKEEINSQTSDKNEKKKSKASKHKLEKMNMNFYGAAEEEPQAKTPTTDKSALLNPALERLPLFTYAPGLIVEVSFLEPCVNIKEYKADMRQYRSVKYVDVKEGSMQAYLRFESPEKAKEFVQEISCAEYQCKILCGDSESAYWQKIEKDREQKLNKQVKVPLKRGREKVKKLITQHIRFNDDDE